MPTYQYACTVCGERMEAVQKFSDAPLTTCPACTGRLRKVFAPVGIVFKGSGFYRTDSRAAGEKKKPAEAGATSPAGGSEANGSGPAEKKAAGGSGSPSSAPDSSSSGTSSQSAAVGGKAA